MLTEAALRAKRKYVASRRKAGKKPRSNAQIIAIALSETGKSNKRKTY